MSLLKYIKQPLSPSLGQYTDAELRKIEASIFNIVETAEALGLSVDDLIARVIALESEAYTVSAVKPADQSITNDNTINADADLVITLTAGIWEIHSVIAAFCAANSISIAFDFEFSATIEAPGLSLGALNNGIRVYDSAVPHTPGAASTIALVANAQKSALFSGIINVLTPGDLTFYWSQGASSATAVTLRKGSFVRARQVA